MQGPGGTLHTDSCYTVDQLGSDCVCHSCVPGCFQRRSSLVSYTVPSGLPAFPGGEATPLVEAHHRQPVPTVDWPSLPLFPRRPCRLHAPVPVVLAGHVPLQHAEAGSSCVC